MGFADYSTRENPPVLHRKDALVAEDHPLRTKFARLTLAEERAGLLDETASIGTREGWAAALESGGYALRGHRLVKRRLPPADG
jgi:hypothetical protein